MTLEDDTIGLRAPDTLPKIPVYVGMAVIVRADMTIGET